MRVKEKRSKGLSRGGPARSRAESLANRAYEQIRDEILQGFLAVGDILSRRGLADRLNMSFLPITEALQRLEIEGLVESRPRIGTRVRIPTRQDVLDSYVIREALETQAARLCCDRMTILEREQLTRSAQRLDSLYKISATKNDDSRFLFSLHTQHMQFHMRIADLARSPGLRKAIEREQVLIFNWLCDSPELRRSNPANFHRELARALCSGDRLEADEAIRNHVRHGLDTVVETLETLELSKGWRLKRGVYANAGD
jgi:GntR family transcriptional regulator, rspAB operon transcriptional repressor